VGGITENEKDRHSPCLLFFKKKHKKWRYKHLQDFFHRGYRRSWWE